MSEVRELVPRAGIDAHSPFRGTHPLLPRTKRLPNSKDQHGNRSSTGEALIQTTHPLSPYAKTPHSLARGARESVVPREGVDLLKVHGDGGIHLNHVNGSLDRSLHLLQHGHDRVVSRLGCVIKNARGGRGTGKGCAPCDYLSRWLKRRNFPTHF